VISQQRKSPLRDLSRRYAFVRSAGPVGALLLALVSSPVRSQQETATALEEVTVTARRTEESLQRTPVAVTAVTGEMLDRLNVQDVAKVAELAPNLVIDRQPASTTATSILIRGIGQLEPASTAEAGVGLYLDGVYIARTGGAIFDLVDLDRIEVLRGPQGTLFGRNTTGGALQLVSRKPSEAFGVEAKAGYARYDDWYTRMRLDTGSLGSSRVKATVAYLHRERDGYFDNTLAPDDRDPGAIDSDAVWVGVHGDFSDRFTATYTFDYNDRDGVSSFFQLTGVTSDVASYYGLSPAFGGAPFDYGTERRANGHQEPFDGRWNSTSQTLGHALTLEYELGPLAKLKSISAYRSFEADTICNLSGNGTLRGFLLDPMTFEPLGVDDLYGPYACRNPMEQLQRSQELQLTGATGSLVYVAGLYYFYEDVSDDNAQRLTFVLPGAEAGLNLAPLQSFAGDSTSKAAFGQVSYRPAVLDSRLELTAGLRHSKDDRTFRSSSFAEQGDASFSNTSWLASAAYEFAADVMAYARVSTAYKAGGFSPRSATLVAFEPEEATAYEIGLKAQWLGNRLRTNLAAFHTDYDDLQVQQFAAGSGGASADTVNAGKAQFDGFEVEVVARLSAGLTVEAAYGYVDPEYDQFLFRDPVTDVIVDVKDVARFPNVAKQNLHAAIQYDFTPFRFGTLSARVDWSDRSERYFHPLDFVNIFNEAIKDPGTENLSAHLTLTAVPLGRGTGEIGVWGDNLTDHDNVGYGIDFGGLGFGGLYYAEPRRYGVDVKVTF
jgi:iron complex outermembrane receptor protein